MGGEGTSTQFGSSNIKKAKGVKTLGRRGVDEGTERRKCFQGGGKRAAEKG